MTIQNRFLIVIRSPVRFCFLCYLLQFESGQLVIFATKHLAVLVAWVRNMTW